MEPELIVFFRAACDKVCDVSFDMAKKWGAKKPAINLQYIFSILSWFSLSCARRNIPLRCRYGMQRRSR